jgi:hypothetical protein
MVYILFDRWQAVGECGVEPSGSCAMELVYVGQGVGEALDVMELIGGAEWQAAIQ